MKNKWLMIFPMLLAACSSDQGGRVCPQVAAIRDLAQIADFGRDESPGLDRMVALGKIESIEGDCTFREASIDTNFELHVAARRGPGLGGDKVEFPYFVAVLDRNDVPVNKQNLSVALRFAPEHAEAESVENIHIAIPSGAHADDVWRVLVGFQLTPEQLAYNRHETGAAAPKSVPTMTVKKARKS